MPRSITLSYGRVRQRADRPDRGAVSICADSWPGRVLDTATLTRTDFSDAAPTQAASSMRGWTAPFRPDRPTTSPVLCASAQRRRIGTHLTSFRQARLNFGDLQALVPLPRSHRHGAGGRYRRHRPDLAGGPACGADRAQFRWLHADRLRPGRRYPCRGRASSVRRWRRPCSRHERRQASLYRRQPDGANFNPLDEPGSSRRTVLRGASFAGATLTLGSVPAGRLRPHVDAPTASTTWPRRSTAPRCRT